MIKFACNKCAQSDQNKIPTLSFFTISFPAFSWFLLLDPSQLSCDLGSILYLLLVHDAWLALLNALFRDVFNCIEAKEFFTIRLLVHPSLHLSHKPITNQCKMSSILWSGLGDDVQSLTSSAHLLSTLTTKSSTKTSIIQFPSCLNAHPFWAGLLQC